jgi:ABC-type sugar transport system ATPase subunit
VQTIYSARRISKRFGVVQALCDVDLDVAQGSVVGLVGANGAGKSTLLKIIAGALPPDSGELTLDGKPLAMKSVRDAAQAGIAIVSQELSLFPALSVEENLLLAQGAGAWTSRRSFARGAREILAKLGVNVALNASLHRLSLADRQLVEISRALLQNPCVLILDEPTSSLHVAEVDRLHEVIRGLRESGIGIIYVSHFLEELLGISDSLVILRNGKHVPEKIAPAADRLKDVIAAMLGDASKSAVEGAQKSSNQSDARAPIAPIEIGPLRIAGLTGRKRLVIEKLEIYPGAIVGVAGLTGAGVDELFAVLFGLERPVSGHITLPTGAPLPSNPAGAVKAGIAYSPADRKQYALMLRQSIAENVVSVRALTLGRDGIVLRKGLLVEQQRRVADSSVLSAARCCSRSATYRAVTSKRSCSPNGWRLRRHCSSSMIRRAALTFQRNKRCIELCVSLHNRGGWFFFHQAILVRLHRSRIAPSCSSTACWRASSTAMSLPSTSWWPP